MRKAVHRTVPIVVAGACAAALVSVATASADIRSVEFSAAPPAPFPASSDVSCELVNYCDSGLDLIFIPNEERDQQGFGGGFLTPNPALDGN